MSFRIQNRRTIVLGAVILLFFLVCYNSQSLTITAEDRTYLNLFLKRWHVTQTAAEIHQSFDSEISFISRVQDSVLAQVDGEQIPHRYFGNVGYYYKTGRGICYDKAALMEKVFELYGFTYRHVYVYFGQNKGQATIGAFFRAGTNSHALLEVKTKKGWMLVDTYNNLLGLTQNNAVITIRQLRQHLQVRSLVLKKSPSSKTVFEQWGVHFRYIYGIYSRHGDFFTKPSKSYSSSLFTRNHFIPDYNLRMLFDNAGFDG